MQVDGLTIKYQPVNCVEVEFKVLAEVGKKILESIFMLKLSKGSIMNVFAHVPLQEFCETLINTVKNRIQRCDGKRIVTCSCIDALLRLGVCFLRT